MDFIPHHFRITFGSDLFICLLMDCPLCHTPLQKQLDPYYFDCHICRALVKHKSFYLSPEAERREYLLHENDVEDRRYQQFVSPITDFIFGHYGAGDAGLDFGCGTGPVISKLLLDRGFNIKQYDPFFAPDVSTLRGIYDYIVLCEVAEHFHRPDQEFRQLAAMLKHEGRLLMMTLLYQDDIDFVHWRYRQDDTHVFIYRRETIDFLGAAYSLYPELVTERFISLKKVV